MLGGLLAVLLLVFTGLATGEAAATPPGPDDEAAAASDPPAVPDDPLEVALVTVGPGRIYWQRFGHNAILVRDRAAGEERLYNFGMFDFAAEDFFVEFARGRMTYLLAEGPVEPDLRVYLAEGRQIDLQWLDLAPEAKRELRDALAENARPENAAYRYDYFRDNCSTRVRDALDRAAGGAIRRATDRRSRGFTYRMHALRLTAMDLPLYLGIHAALGPATDRPITFWDEMFIPMKLRDEIAKIELAHPDGSVRPLVRAAERIADARFPQPSEMPPRWFWRFLAVGLSLAALIGWLGRGPAGGRRWRAFGAVAGALWLVAGLGGLTLAFLMFGSEHEAAWRNENLALFNPLALALLPVAVRAIRGRGWSSIAWPLVAGVIVLAGFSIWLAKVMPGFRQDNLDWIALWLPVHAVLLWTLVRRRGA
jgi:hypothetical protein